MCKHLRKKKNLLRVRFWRVWYIRWVSWSVTNQSFCSSHPAHLNQMSQSQNISWSLFDTLTGTIRSIPFQHVVLRTCASGEEWIGPVGIVLTDSFPSIRQISKRWRFDCFQLNIFMLEEGKQLFRWRTKATQRDDPQKKKQEATGSTRQDEEARTNEFQIPKIASLIFLLCRKSNYVLKLYV